MIDFIFAFIFAAIIIWGVMEIFEELIIAIVYGAMQVLYYLIMAIYITATFVWNKLCLIRYVWSKLESKQNILLAIMAIGCLVTSNWNRSKSNRPWYCLQTQSRTCCSKYGRNKNL